MTWVKHGGRVVRGLLGGKFTRIVNAEPAHVADGRYAIVSVWEQEGEIIVFGAATLEEVKRLPMRKPSGKYNVHNKITRSDGTSH